jgi:acetyl/propionyl-CoA carboxylase alpha subunit/acetyl-CoA carboxylase carboxyltransferase component
MTFTRVAVLNRGDAALRFIRTAREMADGDGPRLDVVAVHTDPDADAPFVRLADDAIGLGPALQTGPDGRLLPAYCLHDLVVERLVESGCDAVWPGWGFASEDPEMVDRLEAAGLTFIGPPSSAMRLLGDKVRAKQLADDCGVPLAPWAELDPEGSGEQWVDVARGVGFPLMVKAANGGGGRGIRRVDGADDLADAVRAVRREATAAFGQGALLVERCIEGARHIEVQFVVGTDGRAETLGVRDCSIQRRHQKVLEEAPSPVLAPVEEARLTASTARLAEAAWYQGVGTAEFLYLPDERIASFCEVNARLQVEHTVTEAVWGVDLVRAQIEIALGRAHERSSGPRGWAVEARVVAEDPERGFAPAPGRVLVHRPAAGPNVRVDAGVRAGSTIPTEFDSMIAKVIAWGPTRERAFATLARAVREYEVVISDGATNRGVLLDLLARPEVRDATATTTWFETLDDPGRSGREETEATAVAVAAVELATVERATRVGRYFSDARTGVPMPDGAATRPVELELALRGRAHRLSLAHRGDGRWQLRVEGHVVDVHVERLDDTAVVAQVGGGRPVRALVDRGRGAVTVDVEGSLHRVQQSDAGVVRAPGPALLVDLSVEVGDDVAQGQRIGTLEAMKTEAPLLADVAGTVERVLAVPGTQVVASQPIVVVRPSAEPGVGDETDAAGWTWGDLAGRASVLDTIDAVVLGREVGADELDLAVASLEDVASGGAEPLTIGAGPEELVQRLAAFVEVESLFERNLLLLGDQSAAVSAESAFHELCRRHGEGRGETPEVLVAPLAAIARREGGPELAAPRDREVRTRGVLWRLAATRARTRDRERLMISLLRAVAATVRSGLLVSCPQLTDIEAVATGSMPTLADAASLVRAELRAGSVHVERVEATSVDPGGFTALERYAGATSTVLDAVGGPVGRGAVVRVVADDDPDDERLVLVLELDGAPAVLAGVDGERLEPYAELFDHGVDLLRRCRRRWPDARRDDWWAAVHVVVHGVREADRASLLAVSHRFEPGTRGLALAEFTVAFAAEATSSDAALLNAAASDGVVEFSLRRRGHTRLEVEAAHGMLAARPRTVLDRRALAAKRLGVVDPWELIGLLEGRVSSEELPHPALRAGCFVEHDLDAAGALVAVDRAPAMHDCSVIVGVVANPLPGHDEWVQRVLIAGDPLRSMGSLGEAECRRIIAAIDLAAQRDLAVEWISLSSGARIAWDTGTENLDWTAAVLRRIVEFTRRGGEIDVVVAGVNVGAQSYWNAEATMLMHTRGILVMTPESSMVLTGRRALEFSGSVGAHDELGIGGHDRIMGPNGQAQYRAPDLAGAYAILLEHHALGAADTTGRAPQLATTDPVDRDVTASSYSHGSEDVRTVGELFDPATNPARKRPFAVRAVMDAVADRDAARLERWAAMANGDGAVVWETRLGGHPVSLIGIESRPRPRTDEAPVDGPAEWAGGTLYPASSKKVARALRAASGRRGVVVLANLSGFDGSPESMRSLQLEHGAEIARAVVEFDGPIVFVVIGRYHGGAYVVFSKRLNEGLTALAVEGSYASVIGGAPAAAVVLTRDVRSRAAADPEVLEALEHLERADDPDDRVRLAEALDRARTEALARARQQVAQDFDEVHTVERAVRVGSLDAVIPAAQLRPEVIRVLDAHHGARSAALVGHA